MEIISSYITIQKLRYENRLNFQNRISPGYYSYAVPKLVIQPLIENAIFYGLEVNVEECCIILSLEEKDARLYLYVKNTGSAMEENLLEKLGAGEIQAHGNGVGLLNIHNRVQMQYGEMYGLQLYNEEDYAVARLVIPAEPGKRGKDAETDHSG